MALTSYITNCTDRQNNGGWTDIRAIEYSNITTGGATMASYTYSAMTLEASTYWKKFEFLEDSIKVTAEAKTTTKGMKYYELKVEGYIPSLTAANLSIIENSGTACGLVFACQGIVSTNKLILGYDQKTSKRDSALFLSEIKIDGGGNVAEGAGATLVFVGKQIETPYSYSFTPALS